MKTPEQIITRALEALGPNGEHWRQGTIEDQCGNMCLVGALRRGAGLSINEIEAPNDRYYCARDAVHAVINSEYERMSVTEWNDDCRRQFAEVRAVLEKARANMDTATVDHARIET